MPTSTHDNSDARAVDVKVTRDELCVDLEDGRRIAVPVAWYPRLAQCSRPERARWRLIGRGTGIHWPDIDEDVSVDGLLAQVTELDPRNQDFRQFSAKVLTTFQRLLV